MIVVTGKRTWIYSPSYPRQNRNQWEEDNFLTTRAVMDVPMGQASSTAI